MEAEKIGFVLGIAGLLMFGLAAAIVIFHINYRANMLKLEKEKQLLAFKAAVEAEERQREKVARNLHDEIIPLIAVIGMHVDLNKADKDGKIRALIEQTMAGIRAISLDLIPKTFLDFGLIKALEQYVSLLNVGETSVSQVVNETQYEFELPFSKNEQLTIYRLCLEILNNLIKHAAYSYLRISLETEKKQFLICFTHDGMGISNQEIEALTETSTGLGLKSLKSRLIFLNATINYYTELEISTIAVSIPIPQ